MSIRTLLIWIIIAGLLGGAALFVQSRVKQAAAARSEPAARSLGFDPAAVIAIERTVGDDDEVLRRDQDVLDRWVIQWQTRDGDRSWPADPVKARSGLRALATARVRPSEQELVTDPAGQLTLRHREGGWTRIDFAGASSGGLTAIRVEVRDGEGVATALWHGRIERSVAEAFVGSPLRNWRRDTLFDFPASAIRAVELESGPYASTLARTPTGWRLERPISVHADRESVDSMVRSLLGVEAESFVDEESIGPDTAGLDDPIAQIVIVGSNRRTMLTVGGRADVRGDLLYAMVDDEDASALVTIETEALARLTAVGGAYVGKTPSSRSTTEVHGLRVLGRDGTTRLTAERTGGAWRINDSTADSLNRDALERLLSLLLVKPSSMVRIFEEETEISPVAAVQLIGPEGMVIDEFGIALDQSESGMRLLFVRELGGGKRVVWAQNGDEAQATGAWLTAVSSRRPAPGS